MNLLRRKTPNQSVISWRAGYGWTWQSDTELDETATFDTWVDAQHWLRSHIERCTLNRYTDLIIRRERNFRWRSPIGQEFLLWKVVK